MICHACILREHDRCDGKTVTGQCRCRNQEHFHWEWANLEFWKINTTSSTSLRTKGAEHE